MKKFVQKIHNLTQKAAEIREAVKKAPGQVAELREAVAATTSEFASQFEQIRQEVQSSVTDLKLGNDDRLTEALHEINDNPEVFQLAGYAITGVDIELGITPKVAVHLDKVEEVPASAMQALLGECKGKKICSAILSALIKAEELEGKVRLSHLDYREATVELGVMPSVRLGWVSDRKARAQHASAISTITSPPVSTAPSPAPPSGFFSSSSYFESRPSAHTPAPSPTPSAGEEPSAPTRSDGSSTYKPASVPRPARSGHESLDRFKKMPDLSKSAH
jgi:hypothetical protein